jgi:hypothetical protein
MNHTFSLPAYFLARIRAVGLAAADRDQSSAALSSVLLVIDNGRATLAATDGKILVEESLTVDTLSTPEPVRLLVRGWKLKELQAFLKPALPKGKAGKSQEVRLDVETELQAGPRAVKATLTLASGAALPLTLTDASFPGYSAAFDQSPSTTTSSVQGLNLEYMARLQDAWKCVVRITIGRGWVITPALRSGFEGEYRRRALVMPCILPA